MRVSLITAIVLCLGLGMASIAQAVPVYFEDLKDWNALGPLDGTMYMQYWGQFSYTHTVDPNPPSQVIDWGKLDIRHRGVGDVVGGVTEEWRVWFVGSTNQLLGQLPYSVGTWTLTTFDLSQAILDEMASSTPWSFQVSLAQTNEEYEGNDRIRLDYSKLYGEYDPVPEASTLILFGSGVSGLLFLARKKRLIRF